MKVLSRITLGEETATEMKIKVKVSKKGPSGGFVSDCPILFLLSNPKDIFIWDFYNLVWDDAFLSRFG